MGVVISTIALCFFSPMPQQQAVFVSLSASGFFELRTCTHLRTCVLSVQMCISFYLYTHQSVSVCHALHLPSPVAPFAVLPAHPL